MSFDGVAGDRRTFIATIKSDAGVVQDVTGWTAIFRYSFNGAAKTDRPMSILGAASNGQFQYQAVAGEILEGLMKFEVTAKDASSKEWTQKCEIERTFRSKIS